MLVDECSMLTGTMVVAIIFFALIQATDRNVAFGGIAVVFFGDVGQLLPPKSKNYIWKSSLFLSGYKYCLKECKRQKQDEGFQSILQMLRKCQVDDADMKVVDFIQQQHCPGVCSCTLGDFVYIKPASKRCQQRSY